MKKLFFSATAILLLQITSAQVSLQPNVPAVGLIQKAQLWNILVINSSVTSYDCKLNLVLTDRNTGQEILTASTAQFNISSGAKQLNVNALEPIQYNYLTTGIDTKLQGLLPAGNYTACYTISVLIEKSIVDECIQFDAEPLSPPMLMFPADSTETEINPAQFTWTPPTPAGMFDRLHYEVIITPINEGQKADEAMQQNLPFYTDNNAFTNSLNYPTSAPAFEKDKWYAWQVIAKDDRNYAGKSETWVFKVNQGYMTEIVEETPFSKLRINNSDLAIAPNGILKIAYYNELKETEAKISIQDLSSGKSNSKVSFFNAKLIQGDNFIQYDLKKIMRPVEGKIYKAELINSRGEKMEIRFTIKYFKK